MNRYILPLGILGVVALLIVLVFLGASNAPDYSIGKATAQPLSADWTKGNVNGKVVLVEYSDFQCPACALYEPLTRQLVNEFSEQIVLVYRHFPLYQLHMNADAAARAAEAAGQQGKFWEMHDLLFSRQTQWDKAVNPVSYFDAYAKELGLNVEQFKTARESDAVKQNVADDYARGAQLGLNSTPTFVLNGAIIKPNPAGYDAFKLLILQALAK